MPSDMVPHPTCPGAYIRSSSTKSSYVKALEKQVAKQDDQLSLLMTHLDVTPEQLEKAMVKRKKKEEKAEKSDAK